MPDIDPAAPPLYMIEEIMGFLPHRFPMLLVDRILSVDGRKIRALKNVTINEPFFQGHYPGRPIMPGVLILEAMAQAGAVLLLAQDAYKGMVPLIGAIDNVKLRRPVVPGDQMIMEGELVGIKGTVGKLAAKATVNGELAASMELTFKLVPGQDG
jgi:3-hydroxyacyl-[acyl-carrier-protein] dehydratase